MKKTRLLIIGTAQQQYIKSYIAKVDRETTEIHLLVPERDRNVYPSEKTTYFNGTFHPLFTPLLKCMLSFRPDEAVIVCGMIYDHDNVVRAVNFYSCFWNLQLNIAVRENNYDAAPTLRPSPTMEILKWVGLGIIAIAIKAFRPLITIRVGEIYSSRLGHLAMECEIYLSERDTGRYRNCLDLFYFKDGRVANKTLADLYCRQMKISPKYSLILDAIRRNNLTNNHEIILNTRRVASVRDVECVMQLTDNHLEFNNAERAKGLAGVTDLGLSSVKPHVCLFGRDPAYLGTKNPEHHDADMQEVRDMNINNLKPCAEFLLDEGYNVLRMGCEVKAPLEIMRDGFMDYSTSGKRSDFMDVYLTATCKFFVGIQSGLMHVPMVFRIPCVSVNVVRLEIIHFCSPEDLAIFKLLWSKSKKRILTVKEQLESGISRWRVEQFANSDIEVIDNTEDEILEATKEMHARVNGKWTTNEEDMELQKRFHSLFKPSYLNTKFVTPVSTYFLRKHEKELF
ncbi:TIGR04372 family glycosyltransferase [Maridesulfovibrio sp. FT414]|uniref:TIGR04372 family glycosyltransferase n=1 Tax=Maridesulfovibrio sp. FT414 TaxID=2979469 RepID=UPI003D8012AD